jgi:uncharacterized membrane protein YtjA (UPF0391 family)
MLLQLREHALPTLKASWRWPPRKINPGLRNCAAPAREEYAMLHYAVVFLVIALIAAVFGFGGIAASAAGIAQILFVVFLILAIASFIFGRMRKP